MTRSVHEARLNYDRVVEFIFVLDLLELVSPAVAADALDVAWRKFRHETAQK